MRAVRLASPDIKIIAFWHVPPVKSYKQAVSIFRID
jgi:hypothetical protein